ncbi:MAG: type I restriction enzyme HsdR N-terminal domain-containing protein [Paludibacteraceae bacterium]|nr:type I restriction enzyme HsdR N-terminal domain-containing protein [Paludibacteraceae bacterium]
MKKERGVEWIYDSFRKMWLRATPEERVRQYFCHLLTERLGYPAVAVANEVEVPVNGQPQRCDTLVYCAGKPVMVVEYKRPEVTIDQRVVEQVARYNLVLQVPLMVVSNGLQTYCMRTGEDGVSFLPQLPTWEEIRAL